MNHSYMIDKRNITNDSTKYKRVNKINNYKTKPILDTSLYKKYEAVRTEKWSILLK